MNKLPRPSTAPHPLAGLGHENFPGANVEPYTDEDGLEHVTYDFPGVGYVDCAKGGAHYDGEKFATDSDVLFIDDVTIREQAWGNGFAGELIIWALEDASKQGFNLGEAILNNPAMVNVLEKLRESGRINEIIYATAVSETLEPQIPAREILHQKVGVTSDEAKGIIQTKLDDEPIGGIRAVFTF